MSDSESENDSFYSEDLSTSEFDPEIDDNDSENLSPNRTQRDLQS